MRVVRVAKVMTAGKKQKKWMQRKRLLQIPSKCQVNATPAATLRSARPARLAGGTDYKFRAANFASGLHVGF